MKYLYMILFLFNFCLYAQLPPNFPSYQITVNNNATEGQIFFSTFSRNQGVFNPPFIIAMNNDGTLAFAQERPSQVFDFKLQPNGTYTFYDDSVHFFYIMDQNFNIIDSTWVKNGYGTDLHDLELYPNGNALLLGQEVKEIDMSQVVQGGNPHAQVLGQIIQELDLNKNVIFEWKSWDHFNITDATSDINMLDSAIDYVHANSITLDTDGNFIMSSRHLDEVTKINSTTGDIMWRLGGENNQFTFINDSLFGFSHQHYAKRIPNGNILLFDNGNLRNSQHSRVVEYKIDEVNKVATLIWQYFNSPDIYSPAMGSAQRLTNGNTVIGWGANITNGVGITEVTSTGEKVFEMEYPDNFSYRAFRFNMITDVNENPVNLTNFTLNQNYPNPFNPSTTIRYSVPFESKVNLQLFNALGQSIKTLVSETKSQGDYRINVDLSDYSSGVYFYSITAGSTDGKQNFHSVKKMVLLK